MAVARRLPEFPDGRRAVTAIWLLDFDGVINAISDRGGRTYWDDWHSTVVAHPLGGVDRQGHPLRVPLLWSQSVVDTVTEAVAAGVDVRWLSTWREYTAVLPAVIPGLPELPFLDESLVGLRGPAPGEHNYSGPWKVDVAKAWVPDEVPLLWTEDSLGINLLSEMWRSSRRGPTTFIQPRTVTGLVQREISEIREWIARHGH